MWYIEVVYIAYRAVKGQARKTQTVHVLHSVALINLRTQGGDRVSFKCLINPDVVIQVKLVNVSVLHAAVFAHRLSSGAGQKMLLKSSCMSVSGQSERIRI